MENKNISFGKSKIEEFLQNGYNELNDGNWRTANLWFDKAKFLDENCTGAYIGKMLCEMEQTSLQSAAENGNIARIYKKIFSLPEKMRQFIFDDSDLINNLFSYGYDFINNHNLEDAKYILKTLNKYEYKESANRLYLYQLYADIENKAKQAKEEIMKQFFEKSNLSMEELEKLKKEENDKKKKKSSEDAFLDFLDKLEMSFTRSIYKKSYDTKYPLISAKLKEIDRIRRLHTADRNPVRRKEEFYNLIRLYDETQEELKGVIECAVSNDIENFECEAQRLNFMVGFSKALIEKYSKL